MKKKLMMMLGLMCGALCAKAAVQYMTVEQKNGEKFSFLLAEKPVVTYSEGVLVVNGNATTSYAIGDLKNFHFTENDQTGVANLGADELRIVSIDENTISVENVSAYAKLVLINAKGGTVATSTVDALGSVTMALPQQKGVYVLTVGKKSFKLIRK